MSEENKQGIMEISQATLENGGFVAGLRYYSEKSKNWLVRLEMAKLVRGLEKAAEEPFKEYQDLLREFGEKNKEGSVGVSPASLPRDRAEAWAAQIKVWREKTLKVPCTLLDAQNKLPIRLPAPVLAAFPHRLLEALVDHITVEEIAEEKEDELARLRKENVELQKKVEARA